MATIQDYRPADYDAAIDRAEAAADAMTAAEAAMTRATLELEQADSDWQDAMAALSEQEAYPGIAAYSHLAAYQPGGTRYGQACTLNRCRIHDGQPA